MQQHLSSGVCAPLPEPPAFRKVTRGFDGVGHTLAPKNEHVQRAKLCLVRVRVRGMARVTVRGMARVRVRGMVRVRVRVTVGLEALPVCPRRQAAGRAWTLTRTCSWSES